MYSRLLITGEILILLRSLAAKYGIDEALILQDLHLAIESDGVPHEDGRVYVQRSNLDWLEVLPWRKDRWIRTLLAKMLKDGLLISRNLGSANWWTIDYAGADLMAGSAMADNAMPSNTSSNDSVTEENHTSVREGVSTGVTDKSTEVADNARAVTATPAKTHYDFRHYDFGADVWRQIREQGTLPAKESHKSILIGSFLVAMKYGHDREMAIAAPEFRGKLGKTAQECLDYFIAMAHGDELIGLNRALDYVKWFVTQEEDDFLTSKGRSVNLCFSRFAYRDAYDAAQHGRAAKKGKSKSRKGSLAGSDSKWVTDEQRNSLGDGEVF